MAPTGGDDDAALEGAALPGGRSWTERVLRHLVRVHQELKRPGVTLRLLWE